MNKKILIFISSLSLSSCSLVETRCDSLDFLMSDCREYLLGIPMQEEKNKNNSKNPQTYEEFLEEQEEIKKLMKEL